MLAKGVLIAFYRTMQDDRVTDRVALAESASRTKRASSQIENNVD